MNSLRKETAARHALLVAGLLGGLLAAPACGARKGAGAAGGPGAPGAGPGGPPGGPPPIKDYPVLTLVPRAAVLHSDYPTILQGRADVEILPKVSSFIDQILVDEGDRVRRGQLLFRLNSDEADQAVRSAQSAILIAQADVNAAGKDVQKTVPLVESKILSRYQLDAYRYTLQARQGTLAQTRADLLSAQKTQSYARITSPSNGVIGTLPYKLGSLVSSTITPPLTTVASIGSVRAYFSINEKQALAFNERADGRPLQAQLRQLPSVRLVLSDGTLYPRAGRIEAASGLVSTQTGSVSVRATFPNPDGVLRSGATGQVRVPQRLANALLVPQAATYELQGKRFVYVVGPGGKVRNTAIAVLPLTDGVNYVVTQGLKAGDQLVTQGVSALKDGQTIRPRPATAADTAAGAGPAPFPVAGRPAPARAN
ncbi:efflux RND transporter periplasmic adaptor subunit [uncultured Hymenobacter sp.]|uniref:efflux RND transporter periplasmic adaptor subunit n=1 Tax=uncultured Hymenobacter sp. TaxID=170016 RepID=UPI0035CB1B72